MSRVSERAVKERDQLRTASEQHDALRTGVAVILERSNEFSERRGAARDEGEEGEGARLLFGAALSPRSPDPQLRRLWRTLGPIRHALPARTAWREHFSRFCDSHRSSRIQACDSAKDRGRGRC